MKRLAFVGGVLVVALFAAVAARASIDEPDPVVIVHWANSHPMREGLLPEMAEEFNKEDHETADGRPIKVVVISCDSSDQAADLVGAGRGRTPPKRECHGESDGPAAEPDDRHAAVRRLARRHQQRRAPMTSSTSTRPRASRRPGWASSPTEPWPSAWVGRIGRSATPRSSRCSRTAGRVPRAARRAATGAILRTSSSPTRTPPPAVATCSCLAVHDVRRQDVSERADAGGHPGPGGAGRGAGRSRASSITTCRPRSS